MRFQDEISNVSRAAYLAGYHTALKDAAALVLSEMPNDALAARHGIPGQGDNLASKIESLFGKVRDAEKAGQPPKEPAG